MEKILQKAFDDVDYEDSAAYMAELLMDDEVTTWKLFERLVGAWLNGNEDYRKGLNDAVIEITGYSLDTIANHLLEKEE